MNVSLVKITLAFYLVVLQNNRKAKLFAMRYKILRISWSFNQNPFVTCRRSAALFQLL